MALNLGHILGNTTKFTGQAREFNNLESFSFGGSIGLTGATGPTGARGRTMAFQVEMASKFKIETLVKTLETFKAAHIEDYKAAVVKYNEQVVTRLKEINKEVNKQINAVSKGEKFTPFSGHVNLMEPINCEKEYDKLINLFKNISGIEVELAFDDANAILNDEWGAVAAAKTTNSYYNGR